MGALDGITVVALEQAVAAPLCTLRLADAGARVIKVERAGGETARHYDDTVGGTSAYFAWLNRGKQSAVLDLKTPDDLALLRRMLGRADVLVQNLAPGALARMGLEGATGTAETPSKVGVSVADIATGGAAHAAVLEALITRGITGKGAQIEIAMFDALADWMTVPLLHHTQAGRDTGRHGLTHASIAPYRPFACKGGVLIIAVQTAAEWDRLCRDVIGRPDLATAPEFATNTQRLENRAALDAALEPAFAAMTFADAIARCRDAAIAYAQARDVAGLADHPALRLISQPLDGGQVAHLPRPAGRTADFTAAPLPALGADTATIRAEFG